ncbi:unnamed protein product [Fusarium equiseti]|uniref:Apple domain-containing protein n=1 Tax=Fusarium equiseti TaxID=61235 RepID=A0A8J2IL83_FUSEQ|nr:unnamed protein product [Fusarium equiseti]
MAPLNLFAYALLALAGVQAGPCRPSSSTTLLSSSLDISAPTSIEDESTTTAISSFWSSTETMISAPTLSSETSDDSSTTTDLTAIAQTTTSLEAVSTTATTATTDMELTTSATSTSAATATSEALALTCEEIPSPYKAPNGVEFRLDCTIYYDAFDDLTYIQHTTFEECMKECSMVDACTIAQYFADDALCCLIEVGFDYYTGHSGKGIAVKVVPE